MFRHVTTRLGNMRRAQEFIVCPVSTNPPNEVTIQSDKRIARVDLSTRRVVLSDGRGGYPGFHKLLEFCGAKEYDAPQDLLDQLAAFGELPAGVSDRPECRGGRGMSTYVFQYRREQRVTFEVDAEGEDEARGKAEQLVDGFDLTSADDESDDPGEIELLESPDGSCDLIC